MAAGSGNGNDITAEEYARWLMPREALEALPNHWSDDTKRGAIYDRLREGLLRAVARTVTFRGRRAPLFELEPMMWKEWAVHVDHRFWSMGDYSKLRGDVTGYGSYEDREFKAFEVRLDPAGLASMIGHSPRSAATPPPLALPHPGGRPRKDFWEPLLTAIAADLYNGDLTPRLQADIERAMNEWIDANGHEASVGAVRERARALWKLIEDKN